MNREIVKIERGAVHVPKSNHIWMTQHEITSLFGCFVSKVNSNIRSILKSGVLRESDVCRTYNYQDGSFVEQYHLEMIIALSFRIQSRNAKAFRKWLTKRLCEVEIPSMQMVVFERQY
ncbi:MAG: protein-tyrosine kinase [Mangrovibacterium sp.]